MKIRFLVFTVCKKWTFYELSAKSLAQKVYNVVYLSEITMRTLTVHDRTADVTYCADITLARDVRWTITDCSIFSCADFSRFIALNAIWSHFLGAKLCFHPILYLLNMLNKTKLTRNG